MSTTKYYILKWIAVITMFIDHIASVFYETLYNDSIYRIFRTIGRLAFPLFCFMLVESFYFTKDRKKHFLKIAFLAVVSEIPFDLAIRNKLIDISYQNVCVTLALGFLMLWRMDYGKLLVSKYAKALNIAEKFVAPVFNIACVSAFGLMAAAIGSDYGFAGIFLIWAFNAVRCSKHIRLWQAAALAIFILMRFDPMYIICVLDLFIIYIISEVKVNDESRFAKLLTGKKSKTICTYFYPVHLAVMVLLRKIII